MFDRSALPGNLHEEVLGKRPVGCLVFCSRDARHVLGNDGLGIEVAAVHVNKQPDGRYSVQKGKDAFSKPACMNGCAIAFVSDRARLKRAIDFRTGPAQLLVPAPLVGFIAAAGPVMPADKIAGTAADRDV